MPVMDMFWGDRIGNIEDPFGHVWSIATHIKDMTPKEMARADRVHEELSIDRFIKL